MITVLSFSENGEITNLPISRDCFCNYQFNVKACSIQGIFKTADVVKNDPESVACPAGTVDVMSKCCIFVSSHTLTTHHFRSTRWLFRIVLYCSLSDFCVQLSK